MIIQYYPIFFHRILNHHDPYYIIPNWWSHDYPVVTNGPIYVPWISMAWNHGFQPGRCRRCTKGQWWGYRWLEWEIAWEMGDFFLYFERQNGGTLLDFEVFPSFSKWQWKITHFVYGFPNEICMVIKYCDCHYQIWSTQKHLAIPERTHEWSSLRFSGKFVSQTRQEYID